MTTQSNNISLTITDADYKEISWSIHQTLDEKVATRILFYLAVHPDNVRPEVSGIWRMLKSLVACEPVC